MKKYVMNKNVQHNKSEYPKGSEIAESADGFNELLKSGHIDTVDFSASPKAEVEPSEESEKPKQSGKQSKR